MGSCLDLSWLSIVGWAWHITGGRWCPGIQKIAGPGDLQDTAPFLRPQWVDFPMAVHASHHLKQGLRGSHPPKELLTMECITHLVDLSWMCFH